MKNKFTFLIISTLIISCIFQSKCCNSNPSVQNNTIENTRTIEKWDYIISKHKLGYIETSDSLTSALNKIKNLFYIKYDSIINDPDNEEYNFFYSIKNENGKLLFKIHPNIETGKEFIYSFEVLSSDFVIGDKDIRVGKNAGDLKKNCSISDIYFDYDNGLFLISDELKYAFKLELNSIHKNSLGKYNYSNINDIPDDFIISAIIIY